MSSSPPPSPRKGVSKLAMPMNKSLLPRPGSSMSNRSSDSTRVGSTRSTTSSISSISGAIKAKLTFDPKPTHKAANLSRPASRPASPSKSRVGNTLLPPSPSPSVYTFNKDPEEGLVDWTNVEADLSGEIDARDLQNFDEAQLNEKVLVSVRVKPPGTEKDNQAWVVSSSDNLIKLDKRYNKGVTKSPDYIFDSVLTGTDNQSVYNQAARGHVRAAMEGYNSLVFAYGQTASGKTFTLMGSEDEPGIIPRALKDVFGYIRRTPSREFLLRASYLEIYNETVYDLLAHSSSGAVAPTITDSGIVNLREEVVTSLKGIKEVIERGDSNRRTASTDWNERSSRSHSVFRLVIESREVSNDDDDDYEDVGTPLGGRPVTPGGTRLRNRGGRSVQSSILNLIDLAGSEKATSDKERTREGKYINTSLLTLGTVIATLAENALRGKADHVPYRNSKLTRMLQPCLSGNARISVICTLNPAASAIGESSSTLGFASRIKKVQLNAVKKEIIDTDALLERYRKEIEELKGRLSEREREAPIRNRRLSAKQQNEESRALSDMSGRIKQLTKLILTSDNINENKGDMSRPASPSKLDFSQSPYELQKELLSTKEQIDRQATLILSLETALDQRAVVPLDAPEYEKDAKIVELQKQVKELEFVTQRYEENLGEPLRAVKEDVEKEWIGKVEARDEVIRLRDAYIQECERALEKERKARSKLEEEKRALATFVADLDSALPALRGVGSLVLGPTTNTYRPTLSALAESDPNTPAASPSKQARPAAGGNRVSSITIPKRTTGSDREALLDQIAPEDVPIGDDDKENEEVDLLL